MVKHSYRPLFAAAALVMALAGAVSVAMFGGGQTPAVANNLYVIEVNTQGFNPRQCNLNRTDSFTFKNVSNVPIQLQSAYRAANGDIVPGGFGGMPPLLSVTLAPNSQLVGSISTQATGNFYYASEFGDWVNVFAFQLGGVVSCSQEAPTPTPTPTGTPTPIATATPVIISPANCTWNGCAVSISIASDGQ